MFSQSTKIPAKVYRSTDKNAPQLTANSGSLKTLLKACLVTGYGESDSRREPLGWEMPFEDAANAVFRSQSPESTRFYLQCLNEEKTYCTLTPYRQMSALMSGNLNFGYPNAQENRFAYAGSTTKGQWILVGCDRAFWLLILDTNLSTQILFFGDARPLAAADNTCGVFLHSAYTNKTNFDTGYLKRPMIAQEWRKETPIQAELMYPRQYISAYPDPIHGGLLAHDVLIVENNSRRAVLPALLYVSNDLQSLADWQTLKLDDDDTEYLSLNISDSLNREYCFLLNLNYFEYA